MTEVTTIGIDIAKNVFQIHGVDAAGGVVIRRQLRRRQVLAFFRKQPSCMVGMEACATAHHWARELIKLGHNVRLIPPVYVKAYVKRSKNDAAEAAARAFPASARSVLSAIRQRQARARIRCRQSKVQEKRRGPLGKSRQSINGGRAISQR